VITTFLQSVKFALQGLATTFHSEQNFRIQSILGFVAIVLGIAFRITLLEWFTLGICISLMLALELINTAIERACDAITEEENLKLKHAKDAAAGACLVVAVFCAITGTVIFLPRIIGLANS